MTGNELIAQYMGHKTREDYGIFTGELYLVVDRFDKDEWRVAKYDSLIDWLYPVYIKLRKELTDMYDASGDGNSFYPRFRRDAIEHALVSGSISELHAEIVKGITFLNEQKS